MTQTKADIGPPTYHYTTYYSLVGLNLIGITSCLVSCSLIGPMFLACDWLTHHALLRVKLVQLLVPGVEPLQGLGRGDVIHQDGALTS